MTCVKPNPSIAVYYLQPITTQTGVTKVRKKKKHPEKENEYQKCISMRRI